MKKIMGLLLVSILCLGSFMVLNVKAEGTYSLKEMTPAIQQALENRRDRFEALKALKVKVEIGENNRGYLESFVDSKDVKAMVDAENADRKVIYSAIAEQNALTGAVDVIEKVFGQVQRDKALPGDKIQNESGAWIIKS